MSFQKGLFKFLNIDLKQQSHKQNSLPKLMFDNILQLSFSEFKNIRLNNVIFNAVTKTFILIILKPQASIFFTICFLLILSGPLFHRNLKNILSELLSKTADSLSLEIDKQIWTLLQWLYLLKLIFFLTIH